ncbi:ABC-2 transporter permease [Clostridium oceanicum]|uniref:ABC transporter permease n=1 Tax=Clostridium oceanicum TaxID=1543 RepID=A0ABN1JUT0_9CLOT
MKKLLKNPLFYKEWIVCRWMALIMSCLLIIIKYAPISNLLSAYKKKLVLDSNFVIVPYWFNNEIFLEPNKILFLFPLILILVILLFRAEKQTSTSGLISSMPFKRKDIIIGKYMVGIFSIFIAFFINFLMMSIFYIINVDFIKTSYSDIPMWYLINFLYCTLFYTFSVFMQTVMGKYIVAIFFTPVFFIMPSIIFTYLFCVADWLFPVCTYGNGKSIGPMGGMLYGLISPFDIYSITEGSRKKISSQIYKVVYSNYGFKILYLSAIIAFFLWLSVYCYKKIDMEKIHYIALFKKFEIIFNILISLNVAVVITLCSGEILNLEGSIVSFIIFFVLAMFISYLLCSKIIKLASR